MCGCPRGNPSWLENMHGADKKQPFWLVEVWKSWGMRGYAGHWPETKRASEIAKIKLEQQTRSNHEWIPESTGVEMHLTGRGS